MFVCIIGTLITTLAQFPFSLLEIGTSKNGVKTTSNSSTSALHFQASTKSLHVVLLRFSLSQSVVFVSWYYMFCTVGHAVCV